MNTRLKSRRLRACAWFASLALAGAAAQADNPANGAVLYAANCATNCHGATPLTSNTNKIYNGRNARAVIDAAIANVGDMKSLRTTFASGSSGLADIAAYLGNTPTALTFASTAVGATSAAQTVTVYASLKSGASISNLGVATSGDFARSGGSCGTSLAVGQSCTIGVVFSPSATGTRSGSLTITHGNTLTPIAIALGGTATAGTTTAPAASIGPASLSFGATPIGATSAAQNLTVANTGNATLSLSSISYGSTDFIGAGGTCAFPGSVAAGASCTVSVAFRPGAGATGSRSATLAIVHNASGSPGSVALTGNATAAAAPAAALTASLAFGSIVVGSTGSPQTATLSNTGTAALSLASITSSSAEFPIAGGTCIAGGSVAAGSSCTVNVGFAPSVAGARSATLSIAHNAAGGASTSALSGTGVAQSPAVAVSPSALSFTQTVGSTSAPQSVTLSNTGTAPLTLGALAIGGAQAAEFSITGGSTCSAGATVAANASCIVRIAFTPAAVGTRSAALSITHNAAGSPTTVALGGNGTAAPQPAIALDASALDFGTQTVGTPSASRTVTVSNSGAATLTLGALTTSGTAAADFGRSGTCAAAVALAPAASCSVVFTFTPAAVGSRSATLSIASDAGNGSAVLSLAGSGAAVPTPSLTLQPGALDFGNQTVGTSAAARSVTLSNGGSGPLAIAGIAASADFTVAHNCGASLAAGASCALSVGYRPSSVGASTGAVTVTSNAAGSPHRVSLSGNGVAASPVLAWSPATTALDFGSTAVGSAAVTRSLTLANQGPGAVTLQQLTLAGANAGDFAFAASSTCAANLPLAQGASCSVVLGFQPGAAGARSASLQVSSSGTNPPDVALSGAASATAAPSAQVAPSALSFNAAFNAPAEPQELLLQSSGSAVLRVLAVRVAAGSFALDVARTQPCQTAPFDLMPGQSCRVAVAWSNAAAGAETGSVEIDTNATAQPLAVPLAAAREAGVMTNVGAGGCSIAGRDGTPDPTLWLLVALALSVLWRRRLARLRSLVSLTHHDTP